MRRFRGTGIGGIGYGEPNGEDCRGGVLMLAKNTLLIRSFGGSIPI